MTQGKICPKCNIRPRKPACGYCRECYNAYNRSRYRKQKELTGHQVYGMEERAREEEWGDTTALVLESQEAEQQALVREGYTLDWFERESWTPHQWEAYRAMEKAENNRLDGLK